MFQPNCVSAQETKPDAEFKSAFVPEVKPEDQKKFIYIPYKDLHQIYERVHSSVIMTYEEYLQYLQQQLQQNQKLPPPVNATYLDAKYQVNILDERAEIDATYRLRSLVKGWTTLPMEFGSVAIGSWTCDNPQAILKGVGVGKYQLLIPDQGDYVLKIKFSAKLLEQPEGKEFTWNCPAVSVTQLDMVIKKPDQTFEVTPQAVPTLQKSTAEETQYQANLGAAEKIRVRLIPKASVQPQMELLSSVNNLTRLTFRDGLIYTDTTLKYDILRGELDRLKFVLPEACRILDVTSPDVRIKSWKMSIQDKKQIVDVELYNPVQKSLKLEIHAEAPLPTDAIDVVGYGPSGEARGIHALDVVRENGILILKTQDDLELAITAQKGIMRIDTQEVPQELRDPKAMSFRYYSSQVQLQAVVKSVLPKVTVQNATQITFDETEIRQMTLLTYQIEKAGIFEFRIQIPDNYQVDHVACSQMKEYHVDPMLHLLTITLNDRQQGSITARIEGRTPIPADIAQNASQLPLLTSQGVERESGKIQLLAHESLEIMTDEKELKGVTPTSPGAISVQDARHHPIAMWIYSQRPVSVPVKAVRKPTRLTARIGTDAILKPDVVEVTTTLEYLVEYAGIDTFRMAVPEAISSRIQIENVTDNAQVQIKQKNPEGPAKDGWVIWSISMQRDVIGLQKFRIKYDLPITSPALVLAPADANEKKPEESTKAPVADPSVAGPSGAAPSYETQIHPLRVLGLEKGGRHVLPVPVTQLIGEVVVDKDPVLAILSQVDGDKIEAIDLRELNFLSAHGVQAYRYHSVEDQESLAIKLKATRQEIQEVLRTVISRELVEVVIGQDDIATCRARFVIKSSERQRLPLLLPEGAEPLLVMVGDRQMPLELSFGNPTPFFNSYFLGVSRTQSSDENFTVTLQYRLKLNPLPTASYWQKLRLAIPKLGGAESAVQQLRCVVWVPEELSLIGRPEHFDYEILLGTHSHRVLPTSKNDCISQQNAWISMNQSTMIEFPIVGKGYIFENLGGTSTLTVQIWHQVGWTVLLSLLWAVAALCLMWLRLDYKVTIAIAAGLVLVLLAQIDAEKIEQTLYASRFGIVAIGLLWTVPLVTWLIKPQPKMIAKTDAIVTPIPVTEIQPTPPPADESTDS
jgi:hypothetical protein